jgi:hypothetical protein
MRLVAQSGNQSMRRLNGERNSLTLSMRPHAVPGRGDCDVLRELTGLKEEGCRKAGREDAMIGRGLAQR